MKFLYTILFLVIAHSATAQLQGALLNKLQHAVSMTIVNKDTTELRTYFNNEKSFKQVKKFMYSIAAQKRKLKMTTDQIGVYNQANNGTDSLTVVYMGGDDAQHAPAMLGQIILSQPPGSKDWIYTEVKALIPAGKVKNANRYLQVYINMQGMPPPPVKEIK